MDIHGRTVKEFKAVADLRAGDETPWYVVLSDAVAEGPVVVAEVRYTDTGNTGTVCGEAGEEVPVVA